MSNENNEFDKLFNEAKIYFNAGDYDKTIECLKKIPESYKNYNDVLNALGFAYSSKGEYDEAIEYYKKIPKSYENYNAILLYLGVAYSRKGEHDLAIECLKKIPKSYEKYNAILLYLGVAYTSKGEHDLVIEYYKQIPPSYENYNTVLLNLGAVYGSKGEYDEAIECWDKIPKDNKNYYYAQYNLGFAYVKKSEHDKAIEYLINIPIGDINYFNAQWNLSLAYSQKGEHDKAIVCGEKIQKSDKNYFNAQYNLGFAYAQKGEHDKAIKYWNMLTVGEESYFNAQYNLGFTYYKKNRIDKAREYWDKILKNNENYYKVQYNLGLVYSQKCEHDKEIEYFKKHTISILEEGILEFRPFINMYSLSQEHKFYTDEQFLEYKKKILLKEQKNNKKTLEQFIKEPLHNNIRTTSKGEKQYILYQYMRCSKETLYRIKNDYLAFTNPRYFNDPYDPLIKVLEKTTDDKTALLLEKLDFRIACLSKNPKSILMWSHYADRHTGICIAYNVTDIIDKAEIVFKKIDFRNAIQIPKDSYTIDIGNVIPTTILDTFTIKHIDWAYEKEYRFIKISDDKKQVVPIVEIYLGKHISSENEELVRHIVDNKIIKEGEEKIKISKFDFGDSNVFELEEEKI